MFTKEQLKEMVETRVASHRGPIDRKALDDMTQSIKAVIVEEGHYGDADPEVRLVVDLGQKAIMAKVKVRSRKVRIATFAAIGEITSERRAGAKATTKAHQGGAPENKTS